MLTEKRKQLESLLDELMQFTFKYEEALRSHATLEQRKEIRLRLKEIQAKIEEIEKEIVE